MKLFRGNNDFVSQQVISLDKHIGIILEKKSDGNSEVKNTELKLKKGTEMKDAKWLKSRFEMAGERIFELETDQ